MSVTQYMFNGVDEVRVLMEDGEPHFIASDIAQPLGLANIRTSLALLDDDEKGVHTVDTPGGVQRLSTVTEAGLYSLILRSRKPEARQFKRWVTHDVLPSIRARGGYLTPEATTAALSDPDFIIRLATDLKAARAKTAQLAAENEAKTATLAITTPKANAFDRWLSTNCDYSVAQVSAALTLLGATNMGRNRLFTWLGENKWAYRHAGQWTPYQTALTAHRLAIRLGARLNTHTGQTFQTMTVRITAKGAADIATKLGLLPADIATALTNTEETDV